jgi:hypothetical protein
VSVESIEVANGRARGGARRCATGMLAVVAAVALVIGGVLVDAIRMPGSDGLTAKLAEWGRNHGMGAEVTWLEQLQYRYDQPVVGGLPAGGISTPAGTLDHTTASSVFPPDPLPAVAGGDRLPGEGIWHTVVSVKGRPAVQVAQLRPDQRHTSYLAGSYGWIPP